MQPKTSHHPSQQSKNQPTIRIVSHDAPSNQSSFNQQLQLLNSTIMKLSERIEAISKKSESEKK